MKLKREPFDEGMKTKEKLQEICDLLVKGNASSNGIHIALASDDETLWKYLTSNELWGGAGSVADQALLDDPATRKQLEHLMIELGEIQMALGKVNVRTEMWTSAFKKWQTLE